MARPRFARRIFVLLFCHLALGVYAADATLRVGLTGKYPPFNYFDEQGELTGFDVAIAKRLCQRLDRKCDFKILQWDGILSALLASKIDVIIGSMAITPARQAVVEFSDPYYVSGAQLFLNQGFDAKAEPRRIGVTLGTTYGVYAKQRFPHAQIRTYKGDVEALQDVIHQRLDGMITDQLVGLHMIKRYRAPLVAAGSTLYEERIGIPLRKQDTQLAHDLNIELSAIKSSAFYKNLWDEYFGTAQSGTKEKAFSWYVAGGLLLRALLNTVLLSFSGIFLGIGLSLAFAAILITASKKISAGLAFYIDFIRSTPFLVQLFAIYFGLPALGVNLSPWSAGILAIAIHSSAYLSEIIKTAYMSVPIGQRWAAKSLGLTRRETLSQVVFPQMLSVMSVPVLNTVVAMIKDSAIVSVISVHELTLQAQELISATFRPLEFYALTAVLYFLLTYPLLRMGRRLEEGFKKKGLLHGE